MKKKATKTTVKSVRTPALPTHEIKPLGEYFIKGLVYSDADLAKLKLSRGDELRLSLEPGNKFDDDAVAILTTDGTRLGYVPREQTAAIHDIISDYGHHAASFRCRVKQFAPTNATHRMILVTIDARVPTSPVPATTVGALPRF